MLLSLNFYTFFIHFYQSANFKMFYVMNSEIILLMKS
jgi:hypothetical protein